MFKIGDRFIMLGRGVDIWTISKLRDALWVLNDSIGCYFNQMILLIAVCMFIICHTSFKFDKSVVVGAFPSFCVKRANRWHSTSQYTTTIQRGSWLRIIDTSMQLPSWPNCSYTVHIVSRCANFESNCYYLLTRIYIKGQNIALQPQSRCFTIAHAKQHRHWIDWLCVLTVVYHSSISLTLAKSARRPSLQPSEVLRFCFSAHVLISQTT